MTNHESEYVPTTKDDIEMIRTILNKARNYGRNNRYGGSYEKWQAALRAIEALDRIEAELKQRQMSLL